jgi:hypothetical protein
VAVTYTLSGTLSLGAALASVFSGDNSGQRNATVEFSDTFAASGGDVAMTGYFKGTATCAAGDWLLAHASDPLQSMGTATYSDGFDPASDKLYLLVVLNTDATNTITISRGTTNGLPIFGAADDAITIAAGGMFVWYSPAGTAALTTGTNDKLTIAVGGGSPTATVLAAYRA